MLHLKERSREFIAAEMWFSFWITASFFLCSKCSLSVLNFHPWDMLLLLRFSDLPVFEKLLMWELFSSFSNSFHAKTAGFITTSTHLSLWTSFDDSKLACFSRFSLKQAISRAAVGWLVVLPTVDTRTVMRDLSACEAPGSALCSLDYKQRSRGRKMIHSETHIAKLKSDFPHFFCVFPKRKNKQTRFPWTGSAARRMRLNNQMVISKINK